MAIACPQPSSIGRGVSMTSQAIRSSRDVTSSHTLRNNTVVTAFTGCWSWRVIKRCTQPGSVSVGVGYSVACITLGPSGRNVTRRRACYIRISTQMTGVAPSHYWRCSRRVIQFSTHECDRARHCDGSGMARTATIAPICRNVYRRYAYNIYELPGVTSGTTAGNTRMIHPPTQERSRIGMAGFTW